MARDPDGDIRVAAEVKVDLKGVGIYNDPHPPRCADLGSQCIVQSDDCQRVGNHEFLKEPEEEALPGQEGFVLGQGKVFSQILAEAFRAVDGTGSQCREKQNIRPKLWQ